MSTVDLPIGKLRRRADARQLRSDTVAGLADSIKAVGIINPLRVRPVSIFEGGHETSGWEITAGRHRFEAAVMAGLDTVPCNIVQESDLLAELAMIDENLLRAELSPADRARETARRKEVYEALHPEAAYDARPGRAGKCRQVGDNSAPAERFTADTAKASGRPERNVQRDAERGEKISERALALVAGTHLDKGVYLDKLKKLGPNEQEARVQRELAAAQAPRKPIGPSDPPRNDFEIINKDHRALVRAWENAHPEAREKFLEDIGAVIDTPVMDRGAA